MRAIGYGRSLGFLLAVVLGARRAGAESVLPRPASTAKASRPNIVLILTDDQRFDTIGAAHAPDGSTPIMPRVASELVGNGVTFTNSFATTALCAPSRASLLSGKYAHSTGVHQNHGPHALAAFD